MIESLLNSRPAWMQLGLVLVHFLWQGAAIALLLAAALWLLRHRSPNARYVLCGASLLIMAACPVLTLSYVRTHPLPILAIAQPAIPAEKNLPHLQNIPDIEIVNAADEGDATTSENVLPDPVTKRAVTPPIDHPQTYQHHTTTSNSSGSRQIWLARGLEWSALVWSTGVVVLSLRLIIGWWRLRRLARRDTEPLPEAIESMVRRLSDRLRVTHRVRVLAAKAWNGPAAFGLIKPVILMPVAVLTQCPLELIEAMIAHELAHIRRYDLWVNLLQRVIETLLFYHPAIWWVSGRMRMERELCCDDLAVQATGRRADYATALVEICRLQPSWVTPAMAAGIFGPKLSLLTRVRRVLQSSHIPNESNRGRFWLSGPLSIILAGAFVFVACLRAADTHTFAVTQPATQPAQDSTRAPHGLYTFNWVNQSLPSVLAILEAKTGLTIRGLGNIESDFETATFMYRPPNPVSLDEALAALNDLLKGQGYWIMHRDQSLEIRKLNDWLRELERKSALSEGSAAIQAQEEKRALELNALSRGKVEKIVASRPVGDTTALPSSLLLHFDNTPLRKAVEEFGQLSGLGVNGLNNIHPDVAKIPITLVIPQPIAFDEALTAFNQVLLDAERAKGLVDSGIWIVRREHELVIRQLAEWPHYIPAQNWFASEADYRQAKLPGWEVARVPYKPRALSATSLAALATDAVPYNTARAIVDGQVPSPNDASLDLAGFVYFIDRQLEVLARRDVLTPGGRSQTTSQPAAVHAPEESTYVPDQPKPIDVSTRREPANGVFVIKTLADGIITEVKIKDGEKVKKGDLLMQFDDREIKLELEAAKIRLNAAKEGLPGLEGQAGGGVEGKARELLQQKQSVIPLAEIDLQRWLLRFERTRIICPADGIVRQVGELAGMVGKRVTPGEILLIVEATANHEAITAPAKAEPHIRHFVMLVLGKGRMTFQGEDVTWNQLPQRLEQVPDRKHTVFEFANTSEDLTMREFNEARFRAMKLQQDFGFEYFSEVGEHALGSKGDPDQVLPPATQPGGS